MYSTPRIVSDAISHTVAAVGRRAAFKEIVQFMQDWKVSALAVLEGEGRVVGVVSEADLLPKEEFRDSDPDRATQLRRLDDLAKAGGLTAEGLMTSPALTVRADATLAQAARSRGHGGREGQRGRHGARQGQAAARRRPRGHAARHRQPRRPAEGVPAGRR
nr:CBS domain-containing protein [Streptomyces sp. BK340]